MSPLQIRFVCFTGASLLAAALALAQDGFPDTTWHGSGRVQIPVIGKAVSGGSMAIQSDAKIVLGGTCSSASGGFYVPCLARLLPAGDIDLSFGPSQNGAFAFDEFAGYPNNRTLEQSLLIRPDGRLLVVGTSYVPATSGTGLMGLINITALTQDGQVELGPSGERARLISLSANPNSAESYGGDAKLLLDGKMLLAGSAPRGASGNRDFAVARLNTDFTLDTTFNPTGVLPGVRYAAFDLAGTGFDSGSVMVVQADGKIVVAGLVESTGNALVVGVVRLNPDGSFDTAFGNSGRVWFDLGNSFESRVAGICLDRQQRIVLTGYREFDNTTSIFDWFVARLSAADGSFDTSFNGLGYKIFNLSGSAGGVLVQPDGKLVVAGTSTYAPAAIRLLDNGSFDPTFGTGGVMVGTFSPSGHQYSEYGSSVVLAPGNHLQLSGSGATAPGNDTGVFGVMRLTYERIFADGFE